MKQRNVAVLLSLRSMTPFSRPRIRDTRCYRTNTMDYVIHQYDPIKERDSLLVVFDLCPLKPHRRFVRRQPKHRHVDKRWDMGRTDRKRPKIHTQH